MFSKHTKTSSLFCNICDLCFIFKRTENVQLLSRGSRCITFHMWWKRVIKRCFYCNEVVLFMNTRFLICFVFLFLIFFFPKVSQLEDKEVGSFWEASADNKNCFSYKYAVYFVLALSLIFSNGVTILKACYLPCN